MRDDDNLKHVELRLRFYCALIANSALTEDSFKSSQKEAHGLIHTARNILYPWDAVTLEEAKKQAANTLIDAYKQYIGDPSDPVFMAKLEEELRQSEEERKKPAKLDDVERIFKAAAERDRRRVHGWTPKN
jgi:hypothetical protein